ncbi:Development/cell death domain [Macleaya cordata]|uniref:Development/cell death domain n=1 Tax=Macleaya cordata TaxID=56857 RepID=A0A200QQ01_MACCD|nr:Development/cell death domain [Macleaya cordata]
MGPGKNNNKAANVAESSSTLSSLIAKTPKSLKPEPKIMKKSPNQNSAKARKAKVTPNAEATSIPSSGTKTPKALKPGTKFMKKSLNQNSAQTKKVNITPQVQEKSKDEKKSGQDTNKETSTNNQRNDETKPKAQERNKEKKSLNQNNAKTREANITPQVQEKPKGERDTNRETSTNKRNDEKMPKSQERNKEKSINDEGHNEKRQRDHKGKEKLGGLIMMCNGKTKPDCFRYRVMGVPLNKKELVLAIKPGLKLFLYDFDLRLLYGIYSASSAGGMKLEPNAFDGAFPVQVRFKVHKDCFPLPEDVFKKAVRDNYNDNRQRFKTELTVQQVKKLTDLFKPVQQQQSNARSLVQAAPPTLIVHPTSMSMVPVRESFENRREPQSRVARERFTRDRYSPEEERRYYTPSDQERERFPRHPASSTHSEMTSAKREVIRDDPLFLSEKEYRTYGLGRGQHTTKSPVRTPSLDPYQNDHHREQLRSHPPSIHRDILPTQKEELSSDPLFLSEKAYRTYGLGREPPVSSPPGGPSSVALDPYQNDHRREHLRSHRLSSHRDILPSQKEELSSDPLFLSEKAYRTYGLGREPPILSPPAPGPSSLALDPYSRDPNYTYRYGVSSSDPYTQLSRRDATSSELYPHSTRMETHLPAYDSLERGTTNHSLRGRVDVGERLYSTYANNTLLDYNQRQNLGRADHAAGSVSSKYSFPGPSVLYR